MARRKPAPTSDAKAANPAPALHALAVAPVVGGIVALLVVVGIAAMTYGALTGVAGPRSAEAAPTPGSRLAFRTRPQPARHSYRRGRRPLAA